MKLSQYAKANGIGYRGRKRQGGLDTRFRVGHHLFLRPHIWAAPEQAGYRKTYKGAGRIIRKSTINLKQGNAGKLVALTEVMTESVRVVNVYVDVLWAKL